LRSDQVYQRVHRQIAQAISALLNRFHAGLQFFLRDFMTGLTGSIDVQQRAAHMVIADFQRAFAFERHVAIGTGDP
jgi:hypothetical protein